MKATSPDVSRPHGQALPSRATASRVTRARGLILGAAAISFVLSVSLWFSGDTDAGLFVGIWVPSIISLGAFLIPKEAGR